jgi:hypothetical protein
MNSQGRSFANTLKKLPFHFDIKDSLFLPSVVVAQL